MSHLSPKPKILLQTLKIAVLSVFLAFFMVTPALAGDAVDPGFITEEGATAAQVQGVINVDAAAANKAIKETTKATKKGAWERFKDSLKKFTWEKLKDELKKSGDIAWRKALQYFLNTMAYDMATYIATGNKGQLPMFESQGWGGYLKNVADNTAGTFMEQLGSNMGTFKFNLCRPNLQVLLRINFGLMYTVRPPKPSCTFTQMTQNWNEALKTKNFLNDFQGMFNPYGNDMGVALTLHTGMSSEIDRKVNEAILTRTESGGFKSVTSAISGAIKTPGNLVRQAAGVPLENATASEKLYTGSIVADSVDIFINTLLGKLIEKWLKSGLIIDMPIFNNKLDDLANSMAQRQTEGVTGAQKRLVTITEPNFKVRADYDILAELATCPDPNKAGPTDCVIDEKFRQAIENKMTVGEALKQGFLSGNGIFGFTSDGLEPKFNEGYPYRSMIILRKYRIIPVGWEVAAQKIKDLQGGRCSVNGNSCVVDADCPNGQNCVEGVNGTKNLNDLISCYSSSDEYTGYGAGWCSGLVDPNWVLKAPQNFCAREGAGPEIISQQVSGEGAGSNLSVLRKDTYCADEQSVIYTRSDGSSAFGYCTEERRKWDFNAKSCEPRDNTCRTFSSPAGETISYLENTLDFSVCNAGNSGCQAYCQNYEWGEPGKFTCTSSTGDKIHLNKQAEECDQAAEGCHQLIRLNPGGGANLLLNSGFEEDITGAAGGGWDGFGVWTNPDAPAVMNPAQAYQGSHSLKMNGPQSRTIQVGGNDYNIAGESYTLSFYAKGCNALAGDKFWIENEIQSQVLNADADWTRYSLTYTYPANVSTNKVNFSISSNTCLIDNIKLERGESATNYSEYLPAGQAGAVASSPSLIYEKLLPGYLADNPDGIQGVCYELKDGAYQPKTDAPAACFNYARRCSKDEAGCELYTSVASDTKIPAKVAVQDFCPAECLNYNAFVQGETVFDSPREAYFIPKTAKTCSAEAVGCDQFTNLDEKAKGGEGVEYYTYLRQCVKKTGNEGSCGDFYNWQGSDESGFQLKSESLKLDIDGVQPAATASDAGLCNEAIYNLPSTDPGYRADCRQFYSTTGQVYYHLYSRTISCTDNCHPYRKTETNELTVADCLTGCSSSDAVCQASCNTGDSCLTVKLANNKNSCKLDNGNVILCKNGGLWSADDKACIYQAVPGQGLTCAAATSGCREYIGNTGNDIRNIFTDDFGNGTVGAWAPESGSVCRDSSGNAISCVIPSNESITLGPGNVGHSIKILAPLGEGQLATTSRRVGTAVSSGMSYVLNFVAKGESATSLTVELGNGLATSTFAAAPTPLTAAWQIYEINLAALGHTANAGETLVLKADKNFYINNISLREIVDRYYLIKDSWRTPASCDQDLDGNPHPLYMLGCSQYLDRAGKLKNLKQFNRLCAESAVGCELMIDTKNSSNPSADSFNAGEASVPADSFIYAAYDPEKLCGAADKGCELLGKPYTYDGAALYGGVYLKNDPDKYNSILCDSSAVGCETFAYDQGEKYFKDPADQACEWRQGALQGYDRGWNWFRKKVKKCDANSNVQIDRPFPGEPANPANENNVCLSSADCASVSTPAAGCDSNADCGLGQVNGRSVPVNSCQNKKCYRSCLKESQDIPCTTSAGKTFGFSGDLVDQPTEENSVHWAGICSDAQSGCTEYIDPKSSFNTNLIFNGNFQTLATSPSDGWQCEDSGNNCQQNITLDKRTIYRLARKMGTGDLRISCPDGVSLLEETSTNNFIIPTDRQSRPNILTVSQPAPDDYDDSKIFYYSGNGKPSCQITVSGRPAGSSVELKKVIIDYQLSGNLDSKSCNGIVNPGQGCVLFDERKQDGQNLVGLTWDADTTISGHAPAGGVAAPEERALNDSNLILKVAPDRTCDKWLACKSYIKDAKNNNVCFDVGLCDAVDGNGNCQSWITSKKENQAAGGSLDISNLSGYTKVGLAGGSLKADYYPFGAMEQAGEMADVSNGSFEYYGTNLYPVGWTFGSGSAIWNANIFSVINNPIAAQTEGIGYAPEGSSFLKLGSSYSAVSEPVDVMSDTDYTITAYLNTKNLKSGTSTIDITTADDTLIRAAVIKQNLGNGWQFQIGKFNTGADSQIKVKLYGLGKDCAIDDDCKPGTCETGHCSKIEGNFYFDAIKIRPVLDSRKNLADGTEWYTTQSCRLYPQNDSLACDYFNDSGERQKGWPGYCLEYDRRPGDPNTCLLWYPVDKVKGDGIEEGAGYAGKMPAYYAVAAAKRYECSTNMLVPVTRGSEYEDTGTCENSDNDCDGTEGAYLTSGAGLVFMNLGGLSLYGFSTSCSYNDGKTSKITLTYNGPGSAATPVYTEGNIDYYCPDSTIPEVRIAQTGCSDNHASYSGWGKEYPAAARRKINQYYASEIVQVVTPTGQNKYWSSRVYKGSDYQYGCNGFLPDRELTSLPATSPDYGAAIAAARTCAYGDDGTPFGSATPPASSAGNPYQWDGDASQPGYQPLPYNIIDKNTVRAGQQQTAGNVARIFAKSYGAWKWGDVNAYTCAGTNQTCNILNNNCPGSSCDPEKTRQVCSGDNSISCNSCAVGTSCQPAATREYRCGGLPTNNVCCNGAGAEVGVTNCGIGSSCTKVGNGFYTCKLGANAGKKCCPQCDVGVSCTKNAGTGGFYRCGGVINGAECAPKGQVCSVCADQSILAGVGTVAGATCGGNNSCALTSLMDLGFYSCGGAADNTKRCCSGDASPSAGFEGNCGSLTVTPCHNNPSIINCSQDCPGSVCALETASVGTEHYNADPNVAYRWGPPGSSSSCTSANNYCKCNGTGVGTRPAAAPDSNADYCAILPTVSNIKINSATTNAALTKNGFINLTFNTKVDSNQLPMVMYGVDWGDNSKTVVTGVEMRDKPDSANPEIIYHLYSYWDLKAKFSTNHNDSTTPENENTVYCGALGFGAKNFNGADSGYTCVDNACCVVKPKIQIKDNWGWCNNATTINGCKSATWDAFPGWVVVTEK